MSFLDHKTYEMKKIAECSANEIQEHLSEFKAHLQDSYMYEQYSPIKYNNDRDVDYADFRKCAYKLGNESVFDLDQLKFLETIGAGLVRYKLIAKDDNQVRNLYVNSGLYAYNQWKANRKEYRIDGENTLRASVLFFEADFKADILKSYHDFLANPLDDIAREASQKEITRLVAVLKKELGKAPNLIMLSKNGVHFYYHLELSLGWTEKGIQFLYDLSEESQMAFCEKAGINSISDLEVTLYPKGENRPLDKQCIKNFVEHKFQTVLSKAGFDSACKDVGTRQIRECGFYHTKNINFPHLIKPAFANLCETGFLNKDAITLNLTKKEIASLKTAMKRKEKTDLSNLQSSLSDKVILKGGELVTYGKGGSKTGTEMSISEIRMKWDSLPLSNGKLNVRLDFLTDMGYNTIGSAFINKFDDGTLYINLVHTKAPKNGNGEDVREYIYPSEDFFRKAKAKQFNRDLGLEYDDDCKTMANDDNLRKIFKKDPVLKLVFNYDVLTSSIRIHPSLSSIGNLKLNEDLCYVEQFNKILGENPCSRDIFFCLCDKDIQTIKAYIKNVYGISYKDNKTIMDILTWSFSSTDDDSVKVNILHEKGLKLYQNWVNQGKPAVLDRLADVVGIRKDIDNEYYRYINVTGSGVARGMAVRMYSFDNPSKVEHCLTISGQQENTGKSHLAKSLLTVLLGIFGDNGTGENIVKNRLLSRFIAQGNLDDLSEGDFLQRVNGVLMILREEAGVDQINKKSNNSHKEFLTRTGVSARTAYGINKSDINFTHYMIMTTNENKTLYADGGNHRRDLRWGLDYRGKDGKYAWPLLPSLKATSTVHNPITSKGNAGFIDTKSIAKWFELALGEALASCVFGTDVRPNRSTTERSIPCMETGNSFSGVDKFVETPDFNDAEREILALINKDFEQTNDILKDAIITHLRSYDKDTYEFKFTPILNGVGELIKFTSIKANNNNVASELRHLGLEKRENQTKGTYWVFADGSQINKFAVDGGFSIQSIHTKSDPLDEVIESQNSNMDIEKENLRKQNNSLLQANEALFSQLKAMQDQMKSMQDQMLAMQSMFTQNNAKIEEKVAVDVKTAPSSETTQISHEIDLSDDLILDCLPNDDKFKEDKKVATNLINRYQSTTSKDEKKDIISKMIAIASKVNPKKYQGQGVQSMTISKV